MDATTASIPAPAGKRARHKRGRSAYGSVLPPRRPGGPWRVRLRVKVGTRTRSDGRVVDVVEAVVRSAGRSRESAVNLLGTLHDQAAEERRTGEKPPAAPVTLAEFRADFERGRLGHAPTTREADARRYDALARHFGTKPLRDLTRGAIEDYLPTLAGKWVAEPSTDPKAKPTRVPGPPTGATVNRVVALLSAIFRAAIDRGLVTENPCHGLRHRRETPRDVPVVSAAELERLALAAPADLRPAIRLAIETGTRRSELVAATWADVDLSAAPHGALLIRRGKSANSRRAIPLTAAARAVVDALRAGRGPIPLHGTAPLLPVLGGRAGTDRLTRAVPLAATAAGLPYLWLHALRHNYAVRYVRAGVPVSDVARLIGDSLAVTAARYARHVPADSGAQAVARLEAAETPPRATIASV